MYFGKSPLIVPPNTAHEGVSGIAAALSPPARWRASGNSLHLYEREQESFRRILERVEAGRCWRFAVLSPTAADRRILRYFLFAAAAVAFSAFCISAQTWAQTAADQPPLKLRIESNLVVVRVVARDAQGHSVENLRKEDFRLFDNGKEQAITQFGVEVQPASSNPPPTSPSAAGVPPPAAPEHFVAFYFDDLDMPFDDVVRARDAADRYLASSLRPSDRAAIFTSSGSISVDFTSDLERLRDSLSKLRPSSRLGDNDCPKISDYQADRIVNHNDPDAIAVGLTKPSTPVISKLPMRLFLRWPHEC